MFLFHFKEESQHAVLDEMEWRREDEKLTSDQRHRAVTELLELVGAVDGLLRAQAEADANYFADLTGRIDPKERAALAGNFFVAYRHQYILSGVEKTRFAGILRELIDESEFSRVEAALATLA